MYDSSKTDAAVLDLLAGSERSFIRSILSSKHDCVEVLSFEGALLFINTFGIKAMGLSDPAQIEGRPWVELWPSAAQRQAYLALEQARLGHAAEFDAPCPNRQGELRWWNVSVSMLNTPQGKPQAFLAISRDISERVLRASDSLAHEEALQSELQEKTTLIEQHAFLQREIDHRVKNSLAQVAAILRLQGRRSSPEVGAALDEAARRVGTIARVHEQLQSSLDMRSVLLRPLLKRLADDFATTTAREVLFEALDEDDLPISSDRATGLMIIISELLANAVRHGHDRGTILVSLDVGAAGLAAISVINPLSANSQMPKDPVFNSGLGTLLSQSYASNIGAEISWHSSPGQMRAMVKFPISH